jgi:HAD superfamily hydrolase (TIGR01458 family)
VQTIRSVLIDIDGVLCLGDVPLPGALAALDLLRQRGVGLRFVTNTTRRTRTDIVRDLSAMGFDIALHEVVSGAISARRIIEARRLRPLLLVHPGLLPDFAGISTANPNAVLIGDAADGFTYHAMNTALRVLVDVPGAPLIALANNRYFQAGDGLALDAGPYVAALEYAAGVRAEMTGKPAPAIFRAALDAAAMRAGRRADDRRRHRKRHRWRVVGRVAGNPGADRQIPRGGRDAPDDPAQHHCRRFPSRGHRIRRAASCLRG